MGPILTAWTVLGDTVAKVTVQVRTHDNLLDVLAAVESHRWRVDVDSEKKLAHVEIVNFDVYDHTGSYRHDDNDLVLCFLEGRIVNFSVEFSGQNPVRIIGPPSAEMALAKEGSEKGYVHYREIRGGAASTRRASGRRPIVVQGRCAWTGGRDASSRRGRDRGGFRGTAPDVPTPAALRRRGDAGNH
jgi:hypothetical protein